MDIKIRQAIVLAGGLGTRLRSEIGEFPKPLAPINGEPFLTYVFKYLQKNGINKVVLSVGYKWELIQQKYGNKWNEITIEYAIENKRLGTGGAIKLAMNYIDVEDFYVLNGDTLFDINLLTLEEFHFRKNSKCSIALKTMHKVDRYGCVDIRFEDHTKTEGQIIGFKEKQYRDETIINGGIYCLKSSILKDFPDSDVFSFESDYLEIDTPKKSIYGKLFDEYFIDIGIPEDYKAFEEKIKQEQQPLPPLKELDIDQSWTLFLDRDGVFNHQIINDYVKEVHELKIIDGVPQAVAEFSKLFGKILVVTNQQGIGKGVMTEEDLHHLNGYIVNLIETYGGKIDKIYFAPQLKNSNSNYRKSGTGMGLHAKHDFPDIDFSKSILIGDSESDIEFGTKLGMKTIMLKNRRNLSTKANYIFENLQDVANNLKQ
jgi:D-glycero-alpha-D-manno-heptose 1-phosphate guanylyltransferase